MFDGNIAPLGVRRYDHVPLPMALSSEQTAAIRKYTTNTLWAKKERVIEFYQGERGELFLKEVIDESWKGAKWGVVIGAPAGFVARVSYELSVPMQLKWTIRGVYWLGCTLLGAIGGGAAGAATFGTLKATIQFSKDMQSDEYHQWRLEKMNTTVWQIYQETIRREDLHLLGFICPISNEIIRSPVRTESGRVFEKSALIGWLKTVTPGIKQRADRAATEAIKQEILKETSPYRDEHITAESLSYDWEYHPALCGELNRLLREYHENNEKSLPPEAVEGLQKLKNSVQIPAIKILDELIAVTNRMYLFKQISSDTLIKRIDAFHTYYDPFIKNTSSDNSAQSTASTQEIAEDESIASAADLQSIDLDGGNEEGIEQEIPDDGVVVNLEGEEEKGGE